MATFTEPITEPLSDSITHRSLWEQGAWNRDQGTRETTGVARIHRHLGEAPATATMDGRYPAVIP